MEDPGIKTKVVHSASKPAWNIINCALGKKRRIASIPYIIIEGDDYISLTEKNEALRHATFINKCFNNSDAIAQLKI